MLPLNKKFYDNAEIRQSKPVLAARYKPGMESGWAVCFAYKTYEGFRIFDDLESATEFYNQKPRQEYELFGQSHLVECDYYEPTPILHARLREKNARNDYTYPLKSLFVNDETSDYIIAFLQEGIWIVKEQDGTVRLWDENSGEAFYGMED